MDKEEVKIHKEVAKKFLDAVLTNFKEVGITGVRSLKEITDQIEDEFSYSVTIVHGNMFEMFYSKEDKRIITCTTYSNQRITHQFMTQVNELHSSESSLKLYLNSLVQLHEYKADDED